MWRGHRWPAGSSGWPQSGHGGRHDAPGTVDERAGRLGRQPHAQPVEVVVRLVIVVVDRDVVLVVVRAQLDLGVGLAGLDRLDHDGGGVDVEGQPERADAELLVDRRIQRLVVVSGQHGGFGQVDAEPPGGLGEQLLELLREQRHLDLLQRHADHPPGTAGLEEERPVPRLAHRPGDEPLRRLECMHLVGHTAPTFGMPFWPWPARPRPSASVCRSVQSVIPATLSARTHGCAAHRRGSPRAQSSCTQR